MNFVQYISELFTKNAKKYRMKYKRTWLPLGKAGPPTTSDNSVKLPIIETQHTFALIITQPFYVLIRETLYSLALLCHNHIDIELIYFNTRVQ